MASSKKAIYAAIIGNFAIAVTKFLGAAVSGSSAMLAEGIHSLVDTGNGGLLLLGIRRSKRPPDEQHPYGYGKSLYFYALIVAVLIFGLGGGISLYEGILHTLDPGHGGPTGATLLGVTVSGLTLNTVVLVSAIVFEAGAFWTAWQEFNKVRGDRGLMEAIRSSKDPTTFTVLFEDSAAMAGLVVALVSVHLTEALHMPVIDGIGSIVIGLILCGVASFLVWESKKLLLGEAADPELRAGIRRIARENGRVADVERMMTLHMGPNTLVLNMDLSFDESLDAEAVAAAIDRIEKKIREEHPEVRFIFIEAESITGRRAGGAPARGDA
jgi:cation diffusion facilitator family transporter